MFYVNNEILNHGESETAMLHFYQSQFYYALIMLVLGKYYRRRKLHHIIFNSDPS